MKGLYNLAISKPTEAAESFSLALSIDPNLLEARRELSQILGHRKEKSVVTQDIASAITSFFKKKH